MRTLSDREARVLDTHFAEAGLRSGARVHQWENAISVFFADTGRLWVHRDNRRKQSYQELVFHAMHSVSSTLTCAHPLKFWDLRRYATARETARLQGFPDSFHIPTVQYNRLFGNAVAVPCARHAVSCVCDSDTPITFVDVCAGIGGFHVAVKQVCPDAQCVGFSEIYPASVKCYRANFPNTPALGDATQITDWPGCDLLCAGFPCQPFSVCNKHSLCEDHIHGDFFKVIVDALRSTGANRVVLENVPAFLSTGRVQWEELRQAMDALGFTVHTHVLDAHDFGLPQARKRVYIVGRRGDVEARPLGHITPQRHATLRDIIER